MDKIKALPKTPVLDSDTEKSVRNAFNDAYTKVNQLVKNLLGLKPSDIGAAPADHTHEGTEHTHDENIGEVKPFARQTAPAKFLMCNGQTIGNASSGATARANADTQALFEMLWVDWDNTILPIQDSSGSAAIRGISAADDFSAGKRMPLPDIRGEFVRAWDDGRGVDSGRMFGSWQQDAIRNITGTYSGILKNDSSGSGAISSVSSGTYTWASSGNGSSGGGFNFDASRVVPTANQNRPRNVALLYCIRYLG